MALAAPPLLLMVFGIIEVSHVFMVRHLIQDAARQGCRSAICARATSATVAAHVNELLQKEKVRDATVAVLVNDSASDVAYARPKDHVTVVLTVPAKQVLIIPGLEYFVGPISGSSTLRLE
jgi:Flp pilus assembly protein TadG